MAERRRKWWQNVAAVFLFATIVTGCSDPDSPEADSAGDVAALLVVMVEDTRSEFNDASGLRYEMVFSFDEDETDSFVNNSLGTGNYYLDGGDPGRPSILSSGVFVLVDATATNSGVSAEVSFTGVDLDGVGLTDTRSLVLEVGDVGDSDSAARLLEGDERDFLMAHVELIRLEDDGFVETDKTVTIEPSPMDALIEVGAVKPATADESLHGLAFGTGRSVEAGEVGLREIEVGANDKVDVRARCRGHVPVYSAVAVGETWAHELSLVSGVSQVPSDCTVRGTGKLRISGELTVRDSGGVGDSPSTDVLVIDEELSVRIDRDTETWELCVGGETRAEVQLEYFLIPSRDRPLRANLVVEQFEGGTCSSNGSDGSERSLFALEVGQSGTLDVAIREGNFLAGDDFTEGQLTVTYVS